MKEKLCIDCGKKLKGKKAIRCRSCAMRERITENPDFQSWVASHRKFDIVYKKRLSIGKVKLWKDPAYRRRAIAARLGQNNPNWRGGTSYANLGYKAYSNGFNREKRKEIRGLYNHKCVVCGKYNSRCVHHIDYDKYNNDVDNLILLCRGCHTKTNFRRTFWWRILCHMIKLQ